jgi:AcrR family transcriptional regulator
MTSGSRPGGRTARNSTAVLDATIAELGEQGYDGLSVESVARRAGVHKTTVYRRWETKDQLIVAALAEAAERRTEVPDTGDAELDLRSLARAVRTTLRSEAGIATVRALVAGSASSEAARAVARRFWAARMVETRPIVERAIARGELPQGTDPDQVLMYVAAPLYHRLLVTAQPLTLAAADAAAGAAYAAAVAGVFGGRPRSPDRRTRGKT